ncbi:hypothetical protein EMCLV066R [Equine molluscum contagiosum-like virus]|nr:hypothetical protein EMCLV066R [Equine molluscum contagiosum-like virus]
MRGEPRASEHDFGYAPEAAAGANRERGTNKTLAVRFVAAREHFPFLHNARACADVLVPTPQELRLYRRVVGEGSALHVRVARLYRQLRYVPREQPTRVERAELTA